MFSYELFEARAEVMHRMEELLSRILDRLLLDWYRSFLNYHDPIYIFSNPHLFALSITVLGNRHIYATLV